MLKVCKFGGTSMAEKNSIEKVLNILLSDVTRRYVVVSAPGKRQSADEKVTDLLYKSYEERKEEKMPSFDKIRERFQEIVKNLDVDIDINKYLDEAEQGIRASVSSDFAASRGEHLCALVIAHKLNWTFVDAAEIIRFNEKGVFDNELTDELVKKGLSPLKNAVIGGFYGSMPDGTIRTFSRGGSDVTGAIISKGVDADIYENWTDVNGFMTTDPRIVDNPQPIDILTYEELRELSYMGASVLHPESIFPLRKTKVSINVRNTFEPENPGTMIINDSSKSNSNLVTGIAGKGGYSAVLIKKAMMNTEVGFARKVLSVFENNGISMEHSPTGIDTLSIIVEEKELKRANQQKVIDELMSSVRPDKIVVSSDLALIAIVGHGMAAQVGTAARVFNSLQASKVNVRMIDQGSSEMNIIVGVSELDLNKSIIAIYNEFFH